MNTIGDCMGSTYFCWLHVVSLIELVNFDFGIHSSLQRAPNPK